MPDHSFHWTVDGNSLKLSEGDFSAFLECVESPGSPLARHRDSRAYCLLAARLHVSTHESLPQRCPAFFGLWNCHRPYSHAYLEAGPENRIGRLCAVASIASGSCAARCCSPRGEHFVYLDKANAELPLDVGNGSPARSRGLALTFASPSF